MHKNDFFPFIFFSYHSFSLSYLEPQIIFPCRDIETRDRDIGPATATLDPRPRHWTRDRDSGPATRDPRPATRDPRPATISQTHSAALPRISERFQRATKHGKFSRAAWEFDIVQNSRQ